MIFQQNENHQTPKELLCELLSKYENAKSMQIAHSSTNPDKDMQELDDEVKVYKEQIENL